MSTAPNFTTVETLLNELITLSNAMIGCSGDDIQSLSELLEQREQVIAQLNDADPTSFNTQEKQALKALTTTVQALDVKLAQHLETHHHALQKELGKMANARKAISHYKFPTPAQHGGVESEG